MAAYEYGAIDPSVSSSATEHERIEARRSFGLSKASYLSQMDSYYAGLQTQKDMQQAGFAQEEKMFEMGAPFEWEKLRLQEMGIETQRYGIDVGAETSRYGADKSAEASMYGADKGAQAAQGSTGLGYAELGAQIKQYGIGNRLAYEEGVHTGKLPSEGFSYEDLNGGQSDYSYDDDYGSSEGSWWAGQEDYDIEQGW